MNREDRTARLTILIDPRKKQVFERLCAAEDLTPSQVVRRLIRGYIEERLGRPWDSKEAANFGLPPAGTRRGKTRRSSP
jgi:Ribbon-helix-helix protein